MPNTFVLGIYFFMEKLLYIFLVLSCLCKSQSSCNYWSTYLGKVNSDEIKGVAVDNIKNSYIIMQTQSPSLTVTPGLISDTLVGFYDAYIAKFDSCGNFIWGTYLGTVGFDSGEKITICPDGNIAFTGYVQDSVLPTTTATCFQPYFAGQTDCFLGKITPNGNLIWLTYFGKTNSDLAYDIACDFNGNIFIGGTTTSANLFVNSLSFQQTFGGNTDAFIAKFSSIGNLKWCTYYGGSGSEDIHALTTDIFGNVYGSGESNSVNLSTSVNCLQSNKDIGFDCYLIKLDSLGIRIFSTYMGGNGADDCRGLAADNSGNIYAGGLTASSNFTTTAGSYQLTLAGMKDMFLAKFSPMGNLLSSTLYGGIDNDAIARLKFYNNQLYAFATTASTNLPLFGISTYSILTGIQNFAIIRFNTNLMPNYSSYFGNTSLDYDLANDIEVNNNSVFLVGKSTSANYPTSIGAFQNTYGFNDDGVLTRLSINVGTILNVKNLNTKNKITLFPNPVNTILFINTNMIENAEVYNIFGQLILSQLIFENQLNVSQLKSGVYFLNINGIVNKFIKD